MSTETASVVGVVAIGRNEGARLRGCLASALAATPRVVYVDSGSTDASVAAAREMGVATVELDATLPFTAARARNAGFEFLAARSPELPFVQFVDGDCEIAAGWFEAAMELMARQPEVGLVCGRRRERFPEASFYNRLCDLEWDTPVGPATWCGGDSLVRADAFTQTGGFNGGLISGEEPEFCFRLRQTGWKIFRIDAEMTLHDAGITRWGQWWRRNMRAGHAFVQGALLHRRAPEHFCWRETASGWMWAFALAVAALGLAWPTRGVSVALLLLYGVKMAGLFCWGKRRGLPTGSALRYGVVGILDKFAQLSGQMAFLAALVRRRQSAIIEYKR